GLARVENWGVLSPGTSQPQRKWTWSLGRQSCGQLARRALGDRSAIALGSTTGWLGSSTGSGGGWGWGALDLERGQGPLVWSRRPLGLFRCQRTSLGNGACAHRFRAQSRSLGATEATPAAAWPAAQPLKRNRSTEGDLHGGWPDSPTGKELFCFPRPPNELSGHGRPRLAHWIRSGRIGVSSTAVQI